MSKQANRTVIGVFMLGAIALVVAAVLIVGSGKFFKQTLKCVMFFEGSVKGLNVGAPVIFRGVKVGTVSEIRMTINPRDLSILIPVYVDIGGEAEVGGVGEEKRIVEALRQRTEVRRETLQKLIDRGLRAQLDMQSFVTGQLQIALDFQPEKPARIVGADPKTTEIPTVPTALEALLKKLEDLPLEEIVRDVSSAAKGINRVVNSPEIVQTLQSVSQVANETRQLVHDLNAKAGPLLSNLEGAAGDARQLLQNVDGKIGPVASNINETLREVQTLTRNVNEQVQPLSAEARETLSEAQKLLRGLDEKTTTLTSRIDETLKDAQHLVRNTDGQIEPIAASLRSTLASIEKAVDEAGVTLRQAQQALKFVEGDGTDSELVYDFNLALRDFRTLAKAIRGLADTLDRQPESAIFGKKIPTGR